MIKAYPPVGQKIQLNLPYTPPPTIKGFSPYWTDSGTSALALAIKLSAEACAHIKNPKVLLPAYGCPDLVAAAVWAKVQPVLVDIRSDAPFYCESALEEAIDEDVVAVVAVNFLGLSDNISAIRNQIRKYSNIAIIEDSAQCAPFASPHPDSDFVLTSFGRGKPINLLGGGVLFVSELRQKSLGNENLKQFCKQGKGNKSFKFGIKSRVFNLLLNPYMYFWLEKLPFLHIGATRYHRLSEVGPLSEYAWRYLGSVYDHICRQGEEVRQYYEQEVDKKFKLACQESIDTEKVSRYLRFPVVLPHVKEETREERKRLVNLKIGVSPMYERPLIEIPGVEGLVQSVGGSANAKIFSDRFLSLPVHQGISLKLAGAIVKELHKATEKLSK